MLPRRNSQPHIQDREPSSNWRQSRFTLSMAQPQGPSKSPSRERSDEGLSKESNDEMCDAGDGSACQTAGPGETATSNLNSAIALSSKASHSSAQVDLPVLRRSDLHERPLRRPDAAFTAKTLNVRPLETPLPSSALLDTSGERASFTSTEHSQSSTIVSGAASTKASTANSTAAVGEDEIEDTTDTTDNSTQKISQATPEPLRVPASCLYTVGRELGKGSYSVVREAKHTSSGKFFAAKIINKQLMRGREHLVRNEIVVLRRLSSGHPNILTLVDYFETDNNLYLVTELAKGGELFDRIYSRGSFYESDAAKMVREITSGVAYLHKHGIVHRDLKPENLLFKTTSSSSRLLIADFGLSRIIDEERLNMLMTTCGTPSYMAPEIFTKAGHAKPVDVWAIGVITYFLLSGYTPFDRENPVEERKAILKGDYEFAPEEYWIHVSGDAVRFIKACLHSEPSARLTAEQCLEQPFLIKKYRRETDLLPGVMANLSLQRSKSTQMFPSTLTGDAMQGRYSTSPVLT